MFTGKNKYYVRSHISQFRAAPHFRQLGKSILKFFPSAVKLGHPRLVLPCLRYRQRPTIAHEIGPGFFVACPRSRVDPSVCRHLKIAGRVPISRFFHVTSQQSESCNTSLRCKLKPQVVGSRNSSWLPSNPKRLVMAASLGFPTPSNFLTIGGSWIVVLIEAAEKAIRRD